MSKIIEKVIDWGLKEASKHMSNRGHETYPRKGKPKKVVHPK